jgi:hypothetical protein
MVILVATLLIGCGDPKTTWRSEGRKQAKSDIAAGKLCLKTYGLPPEWTWKYESMAKEKYGVEFDAVAGCVVNDELMERTDGYNELMLQEIKRRFGPNALEKLAEEARVKYQQEEEAHRQP